MIPADALEADTDAALPMPLDLVIEAFEMPLLVVSLEAKTIEDDMGDRVASYEVTLKAALPERFAAELLRMVRNHRIDVVVKTPDDGEVEQ